MPAPVLPAPTGLEHPSLVPAQLLAAADLAPAGEMTGRVRRSVRDWCVDVTVFLLSLALGLVLLGMTLSMPDRPSDGLLFADFVVGTAGCCALWLRRRWPVEVAITLAVVGAFSEMSGFAGMVALFTVAVHRRWPTVVAVTAVNLAGYAGYLVLRPDPDLSWWAAAALGAVLTAAVVA